MSSCWNVLFRLHNLVKIPPSVCVESDDERVFTIIARAIAPDGSVFPGCAEVQASFTPRDVFRSPPTSTGSSNTTLLEVKLDGSSERSAAAAAEWTLDAPVVDLLLILREWHGGDSVMQPLGPVSRLHIDAADVVRRRKLATHVVGTVLGQLGLSVAVAPSDNAGYRERLEEFLSKHNPSSLALVESVVGSIGEIDTFTKLYRKYGIVDYKKRVEDFFRLYGREHMGQIPILLQEWENREEELLHNLVLDNGPEPDTIDLKTRINAFLHEHKIPPGTEEVIRAVEELGDTPRELFGILTAKYGPEPDPREYLFPPSQYNGANSSAHTTDLRNNGSHVDKKHVSETNLESQAPSIPSLLQSRTSKKSSSQDDQLELSERSTQQGEPDRRFQVHPHASLYSRDQPLCALSMENPVGTNASRFDTSAAGAHNRGDQLWADFSNALNRNGRSPLDVYYMREAVFASLLETIGYNTAERDALLLQWQRRVRGAVREESLLPGDAHYETAKAEVLEAVGLQPLQLDTISVTAVTNREHRVRFSERLHAAKTSSTERFALIGEYSQLRSIVTHGVGGDDIPIENVNTDDTVSAESYKKGNSKSLGHGFDDAVACVNAVAVFHRRPFYNWSHNHPISILVCDVVVGAPFVSAPHSKNARAATAEFRAEYDSCVFNDAGGGEVVAVYDAAQVFPRYIVQCRVDTSAAACPAHPTRAVEYFVPEARSFACSRCVVLGAHRGAHVLTVSDAAAQARARLVDHQRAAAQYVVTLDAVAAGIAQDESAVHKAPRRVAAEREIERIRLEAEERVRAITQALERDEAEILANIAQRREESDRARGTAEAVAENISVALQLTSPHDIVTALQRIETAGELQQLQRQQEYTQEQQQQQKGLDLSIQDSSYGQLQGGSQSKEPKENHSQQSAGGQGVLPMNPKDAANQSLYEKYLTITESNKTAFHNGNVSYESRGKNNNNANISSASSTANASAIRSIDDSGLSRGPKEEVTRGWTLFRQGDLSAAREIWESVHKRFPNEAVGARVRAYIAEAIERDYESAATWYRTALERDPRDSLTLYNYGVLLEALLGRRQEALMLFDRASALGDTTAARRARQLRAMM